MDNRRILFRRFENQNHAGLHSKKGISVSIWRIRSSSCSKSEV